MPDKIAIFLLITLVAGFAFQLVGIYKAISSIPSFLDWAKRLAHRNSTVLVPGTATMNLKSECARLRAFGTSGPPPNATLEQLTKWTHENIIGVSNQIAAAFEELDKSNNEKTREIQHEQNQRNETDKEIRKTFQESAKTANSAAWLLLIGTILLALTELGKWCLNIGG